MWSSGCGLPGIAVKVGECSFPHPIKLPATKQLKGPLEIKVSISSPQPSAYGIS